MISCTVKMRSVMLVVSTCREIVPAYGVSTGATMGGGIVAGCGPGVCAKAVVVTARHTAAKTAAEHLRREIESGMRILRNCKANSLYGVTVGVHAMSTQGRYITSER